MITDAQIAVEPLPKVPMAQPLTATELAVQRKIQISGEHAVLNLEEFCVYTGRSRDWVLRYLKAGSIPGYFSVSREHHQFHLATYLALSAINRETRRKCR